MLTAATDIYFAREVTCTYIALYVCKQLKIVPEVSPYLTVSRVKTTNKPGTLPPRPARLTFLQTEDNFYRLQQLIIETFATATLYIKGNLRKKPHKLRLKDKAI